VNGLIFICSRFSFSNPKGNTLCPRK